MQSVTERSSIVQCSAGQNFVKYVNFSDTCYIVKNILKAF